MHLKEKCVKILKAVSTIVIRLRKGRSKLKKEPKRGIPIPTRIIISAVLLLAQFAFLFAVLYNITIGSAWLYAFSMLIAAVTVVVIINRRGNPEHKISWLVFILVFPIFGITLFCLWGGRRVMPHIRRKMEKAEARYLPLLPDDTAVRNRTILSAKQIILSRFDEIHFSG